MEWTRNKEERVMRSPSPVLPSFNSSVQQRNLFVHWDLLKLDMMLQEARTRVDAAAREESNTGRGMRLDDHEEGNRMNGEGSDNGIRPDHVFHVTRLSNPSAEVDKTMPSQRFALRLTPEEMEVSQSVEKSVAHIARSNNFRRTAISSVNHPPPNVTRSSDTPPIDNGSNNTDLATRETNLEGAEFDISVQFTSNIGDVRSKIPDFQRGSPVTRIEEPQFLSHPSIISERSIGQNRRSLSTNPWTYVNSRLFTESRNMNSNDVNKVTISENDSEISAPGPVASSILRDRCVNSPTIAKRLVNNNVSTMGTTIPPSLLESALKVNNNISAMETTIPSLLETAIKRQVSKLPVSSGFTAINKTPRKVLQADKIRETRSVDVESFIPISISDARISKTGVKESSAMDVDVALTETEIPVISQMRDDESVVHVMESTSVVNNRAPDVQEMVSLPNELESGLEHIRQEIISSEVVEPRKSTNDMNLDTISENISISTSTMTIPTNDSPSVSTVDKIIEQHSPELSDRQRSEGSPELEIQQVPLESTVMLGISDKSVEILEHDKSPTVNDKSDEPEVEQEKNSKVGDSPKSIVGQPYCTKPVTGPPQVTSNDITTPQTRPEDQDLTNSESSPTVSSTQGVRENNSLAATSESDSTKMQMISTVGEMGDDGMEEVDMSGVETAHQEFGSRKGDECTSAETADNSDLILVPEHSTNQTIEATKSTDVGGTSTGRRISATQEVASLPTNDMSMSLVTIPKHVALINPPSRSPAWSAPIPSIPKSHSLPVLSISSPSPIIQPKFWSAPIPSVPPRDLLSPSPILSPTPDSPMTSLSPDPSVANRSPIAQSILDERATVDPPDAMDLDPSPTISLSHGATPIPPMPLQDLLPPVSTTPIPPIPSSPDHEVPSPALDSPTAQYTLDHQSTPNAPIRMDLDPSPTLPPSIKFIIPGQTTPAPPESTSGILTTPTYPRIKIKYNNPSPSPRKRQKTSPEIHDCIVVRFDFENVRIPLPPYIHYLDSYVSLLYKWVVIHLG